MIQRRLQDPLAMKLLQGEFEPGQTVAVDFADGAFTFAALKREPVPAE